MYYELKCRLSKMGYIHGMIKEAEKAPGKGE